MAWATGDPGIIFIDRMNRDNPTPRARRDRVHEPLRRAAAAAVRGMQPRLHESLELRRHARRHGPDVDWDRLADVDPSRRALPRQRDRRQQVPPARRSRRSSRGNRKIGLGVMGWADMLIKMDIGYDTEDAVALGEKIMGFIDAEGEVRVAEAGRGARARSRTSRARSTTRPKAAKCATPPSRRSPRPARSRSSPTARAASSRCSRCRYVRTVMDNDRLIEVNPLFEEMAVQARLLLPRAHGSSSPITARCRHRRGARGRAPRVRHRARHRAGVAHPHAGGVPEAHRQRGLQDRELRAATRRPTTCARSTTWRTSSA